MNETEGPGPGNMVHVGDYHDVDVDADVDWFRCVHPRMFAERAAAAGAPRDIWSNNPCVVRCYPAEQVVVWARSRETGRPVSKLLSEHPQWGKWKEEMNAGEFWSMMGEKWILG
jgi:hypothetical protein